MFCECGKICYENSKDADIAVANLSKNDRKHKYSFYKCDLCRLFHTSTVKLKRMLLNREKDKYPFKYTPIIKEEQIIKPKNKKRWR